MSIENFFTQPNLKSVGITRLEKFDLNMMNFLLGSTDIISFQEKSRLSAINKGRTHGHKHLAQYRLGKKSDLKLSPGSDFSYVGRWFAEQSVGLQGLQNNIRGALAQKYYWDIDMVNAHPTMLVQLCKKNGWACPYLTEMCLRREELFKEFALENPIFTRKYCKTAVIKLLYGGVPDDTKIDGDMPIWLWDNLYPELLQIMKNLSVLYPAVFKSAKKSHPLNPLGSCAAYILQTHERNCLMAMMEYFESKGRYLGVLIHDGGYVEKIEDEEVFPENLLRGAEAYILKTAGFSHRLEIKPITTDFVLPTKESLLNPDKSYEAIKLDFEKNAFKVIQKGSYYISNYSDARLISQRQLTDAYRHIKYECVAEGSTRIESKTFITRWIDDETIRRYDTIGFYPPPYKCPDSCYNTWSGFKIQNLKEKPIITKASHKKFKKALEHMKLLFSEECYEYGLDWIAQLFQYPGKKSNVAILFKSIQGLGKGLLFQLLEAMIGKEHCYIGQKVERDLFGTFNGLTSNKILLVLDEMVISVATKFENEIKDCITCETANISKKGQDCYSQPCFARFLVFANRDFPWRLDRNDRRLMAIDRCDEVVKSDEYYRYLRDEILTDDSALSLLFDFFMTRDISKFNPKTDRPLTAFSDTLKILSRSIEEDFIIHFISELNKNEATKFIGSMDLWKEFDAFVKSSQIGGVCGFKTIKMFSMKINNLKITGCSRKKTSTKNGYLFDIPKALEWLDEKYPDVNLEVELSDD